MRWSSCSETAFWPASGGGATPGIRSASRVRKTDGITIPTRTTRATPTMKSSMRLNPLSSPTIGALLRHRCKPILLSLLQNLTPWDIFLKLVNDLSGILGLQVIRIHGRLHARLGQFRLEGLRGQMSAHVCAALGPVGEGGPDHDCPEVRDVLRRLPDCLRRARISQVKQGSEIALDEIANTDHRMGQANRDSRYID